MKLGTLILCASLTACGGASSSSVAPSPVPTPSPSPAPAPTPVAPLSCTPPDPAVTGQARVTFGRAGRAYVIYPAGPGGTEIAEIHGLTGSTKMGVQVSIGDTAHFDTGEAERILIQDDVIDLVNQSNSLRHVCWTAKANTPYTLFVWDAQGSGGDLQIGTTRPR